MSYNISYIILSILAAIISSILAFFILRKRKDPFLCAFATMSIIFSYGLLEQQYSINTPLIILILSHLFWITFFILTLVIARPLRPNQFDSFLFVLKTIPQNILLYICLFWIFWKYFLFQRYGANVFAFTTDPDYLPQYELWEELISTFLNFLLLGTFVTVIARYALGMKIPNFLNFLFVFNFLFYFFSGESPIGARRLLFGLLFFWFSVILIIKRPFHLIKKYILTITFVLFSFALAAFYQKVRGNVGNPTASQYLKSNNPVDFIKGFALFLNPNLDVYSNQTKFFRSGPFDFFAKVVERVIDDKLSTKGESILVSLKLSVPRRLYPGEKPKIDVDNILEWNLKVYPEFFSENYGIDYPTSLESIAFADAGIIGLLFIATLFGLIFWITKIGIIKACKFPIIVLALLGIMITLIAGKENSATGIFASIRNFIFLIIVYMPVHLIYAWIKQTVNIPIKNKSI